MKTFNDSSFYKKQAMDNYHLNAVRKYKNI